MEADFDKLTPIRGEHVVTLAQYVGAACPVRDLCLEYALADNIEHAVWGGASEQQRHRIHRRCRHTSAIVL